MAHVTNIDGDIRTLPNDGFGAEGYGEPGNRHHVEVVGAVPDGHGVFALKRAFSCPVFNRLSLCGSIDNRAVNAARALPERGGLESVCTPVVHT